MQISHLRDFIAVANTLSFSKAAASLHMATSAVSKHVSDLESELGTQLFRRTTRTVTLTQAGLTLLPKAHRLVQDFDSLRTTFADETAPRPLRIGVRSVPTDFVDRMRTITRAALPGRPFIIEGRESEAQLRSLLSGDLDLGFTWSTRDDPRLARMPVLHETVAVLVPNSKPFSDALDVSPADLDGLSFAAMFDPDHAPNEVRQFLTSVARIDRVDDRVGGALRMMMADRRHFSIVPGLHPGVTAPLAPDIVIKPIRPPAPIVTTYLTWRADRENSRDLGPLLDAIRPELRIRRI